MLSKTLALALACLTSMVCHGQLCPNYPVQTTCNPGDGTSCSKLVYPQGPLNAEQGPYELLGTTSCCGVTITIVAGWSYPIGCFTTELRTPEAIRNLRQLSAKADLFALNCTGEMVPYRLITSRVPKVPKISIQIAEPDKIVVSGGAL